MARSFHFGTFAPEKDLWSGTPTVYIQVAKSHLMGQHSDLLHAAGITNCMHRNTPRDDNACETQTSHQL